MLDKLGEWYRVVTLDLEHEKLKKRKRSIENLIPILKRKSKVLVPEAVTGLAWRFDPDSEIASTLTKIIYEQDFSFPTNMEENELELRAVAGLALGEVIKGPKRSKARSLAATFTVSALGIPRDIHSQTQHLTRMLGELRSVAIDVLDKEAVAVRKAPFTSAQPINIAERFENMKEAAQGSDIPNQPLQLWLAVAPVLEQTLGVFQKRLEALELVQKADREELEALWWSYSGRSKATGEPFSRMSSGAAALCAGRELADICLIPPLLNTRCLLEDVVFLGRSNASQKTSLENIISEWSESILVNDVQHGSDIAQELVKKCPALLPISWITQR